MPARLKNPEDRVYQYDRKTEDPTTQGAIPPCPKGVSRHAWQRICAELAARRTITRGDGDLIKLLCIVTARHNRALAKLAADGDIMTVTKHSPTGAEYVVDVPNPALKIAQDCERMILQCLNALTLTPATRDKAKPTLPVETPGPKVGSVNWIRMMQAPQPAEVPPPTEEESAQ